MGEAFIVRRGGGGTLFAAIGVTYPVGSICTCSNGTITLTAGNTSGTWIFSIPSTGTWTVAITDGTETASKNVSITAQGQCKNVEVTYSVLLLPVLDAVNVWEFLDWTHGNPITQKTLSDTEISLTPARYAERGGYVTQNAVDLTGKTRIDINVTSEILSATNFELFVSSTKDATSAAAKINIDGSGASSMSINLSGSYYIGIGRSVSNANYSTLTVNRVEIF